MTNDKNYTTTYVVEQSPEAVFAAVANPRGWWSADIEGNTEKLGEVWFYHAPQLHTCTLKVIESVPGKSIAWRVLDNHFSFTADKTEWIGTTLVFDIEPAAEGGTRLTFTHVGLVPDYECYDVCHDAWGTYIRGSLKNFITTGTGIPNAGADITADDPADIQQRANEMRNQSYTTTITVDANPEMAFAAINNPRAWWTGEFEGDTDRLGASFSYRYKEFHYSKQEIIELVPNSRVAWHVVEGMLSFVEDTTEWAGTTITFDIRPKGNKTEVVFTHVGLKPTGECYDTCSDAWGSLIKGSLKQAIETGAGIRPVLDAPVAA